MHFLCPDPGCLSDRFVVFETEADLEDHILAVHPFSEQASQIGSSRPLRLDIQFNGVRQQRQEEEKKEEIEEGAWDYSLTSESIERVREVEEQMRASRSASARVEDDAAAFPELSAGSSRHAAAAARRGNNFINAVAPVARQTPALAAYNAARGGASSREQSAAADAVRAGLDGAGGGGGFVNAAFRPQVSGSWGRRAESKAQTFEDLYPALPKARRKKKKPPLRPVPYGGRQQKATAGGAPWGATTSSRSTGRTAAAFAPSTSSPSRASREPARSSPYLPPQAPLPSAAPIPARATPPAPAPRPTPSAPPPARNRAAYPDLSAQSKGSGSSAKRKARSKPRKQGSGSGNVMALTAAAGGGSGRAAPKVSTMRVIRPRKKGAM
mmetsp:Transcript_1086/g.4602  ORF Transcript_1086/g.4602 Transcript_1086/m.4602 type:complete len:383 (-) Transcript_1086:89-1237(-)